MDYIWFIQKHLGKDIWNDYVQISNWRDYEVVIYDATVFRFPKNKEKTLNMVLEKQKLDIVAQYVDIKVPQYTIIDDVCITYPLMPWVPFDTLNVVYTDSFIEDIVSFLKQLHSIPLQNFWFLDAKKEQTEEEKKEFLDFVNKLKDKIRLRLQNRVPDWTIENIHTYMDKLFFEYDSPKKVFVHTDIQGKNIIYDTTRDKISWIIDFTDSRIWWAELDFCHFYDVDEYILRKMISLYVWFDDEEFFERVFFLARRWVIFEIDNDEICENNFEYILWQLKKYKFLY